MTVYVVEYRVDWEGSSLVQILSTHEAAIAFVETIIVNKTNPESWFRENDEWNYDDCTYSITEWKVN